MPVPDERPIAELLGELALFESLSPDELAQLATGCRLRSLPREAVLFREGERASGMYIVLEGVVKVIRISPEGRETILHLVRHGNTIGEAAVFQQGTFPSTAVAVSPVRLLFLQAETVVRMVTENPGLALRMLAVLSLRLRMFSHKVAAQGQGGAARRLAAYLLHRTQIEGKADIQLGVSREVLANLLGLARETLSRQLSSLADRGVVELSGKRILVLDEAALRQIIEEG